MIGRLASEALRAVPVGAVMQYLSAVAQHDRYQASLGIQAAAAVVAQAARAVGLQRVSIVDFPSDSRWWTFQPPASWTPVQAKLRVCADHPGHRLVIDHALHPFSIATHSASTPSGGLRGLVQELDEPFAGALVLLDREAYAEQGTLARLVEGDAAGFITDGTACSTELGQFPGRVELPAGTRLIGFSVTPAQLAMVRSWRAQGDVRFHTKVVVDRSATMPIVTACIPGELPGEIWLTAHLCHPRPGANDNASGVAGLLGVAATLRELLAGSLKRARGRTIRFFWGPEFTGTAAYLHQTLCADSHPHALINLDMIGENQALCGSPFVVEHGPDFQSGLMAAVAEAVVAETFARTVEQPGEWRRAPFYGYSDHALFAGPHAGCPLVQFAHWPDRFNHSAADTLDKVCKTEMRRATAAAAVLAAWAAGLAPLTASQKEAIVDAWGLRSQRQIDARSLQYAGSAHAGWAAEYGEYTLEKCQALRGCQEDEVPHAAFSATMNVRKRSGAVMARFEGPVNVRGLIASLGSDAREEVYRMIRADKRTLALLLNFSVRCDGTRSPEQLIRETHFALGIPPDAARADFLLNQLIASPYFELLA